MSSTQVAIYARVSSDQQAEAQTVASQVAALRERVAAEGLALPDAMQFIDEGYSGATLLRPALERLRDVIAARAVDRLYVHSPDRLARKYAYQVLLVDEFRRAGQSYVIWTPDQHLSRSISWPPPPVGRSTAPATPRSSSSPKRARARSPISMAWGPTPCESFARSSRSMGSRSEMTAEQPV